MAYSTPLTAAPWSAERAVGIDAFVSQVPPPANAFEADVNAIRPVIIVAKTGAIRVFIFGLVPLVCRQFARFYGNCPFKYSTSFPQRWKKPGRRARQGLS
jgi:hypothetical protein